MSCKLVSAAVAAGMALSGCNSVGDWGPYYPEPFGNYVYGLDKFGKLQCTSGKHDVSETGFTPWFKGAVRFKPNPIVNICSIEAYEEVQNRYLSIFFRMSGYDFPIFEVKDSNKEKIENVTVIAFPVAGKSDINNVDAVWKSVTKNGMNYVDGVCHDYLRQLYRLKKNTKGLRSLTYQTGYTAQQIVGNTLIGSSDAGKVLAIMAAAFGLGATVFDIYESSILLEADYSAVYAMVKLLQAHIAGKVETDVMDRASAVKALQSYLYVCTPQAIEAAINLKIGGDKEAELLKAMGIEKVDDKEISGIVNLIGTYLAEKHKGTLEIKNNQITISTKLPAG